MITIDRGIVYQQEQYLAKTRGKLKLDSTLKVTSTTKLFFATK